MIILRENTQQRMCVGSDEFFHYACSSLSSCSLRLYMPISCVRRWRWWRTFVIECTRPQSTRFYNPYCVLTLHTSTTKHKRRLSYTKLLRSNSILELKCFFLCTARKIERRHMCRCCTPPYMSHSCIACNYFVFFSSYFTYNITLSLHKFGFVVVEHVFYTHFSFTFELKLHIIAIYWLSRSTTHTATKNNHPKPIAVLERCSLFVSNQINLRLIHSLMFCLCLVSSVPDRRNKL